MPTQHRHAADPDVLAGATGLVHFLRELVQSRHQRQRDARPRKTQERVWLTDLPASLPTPRSRQDGVLLTLDHVPQSSPPEVPVALDGWIDPERCLDPDGGDPPLADEGPGEAPPSGGTDMEVYEEDGVNGTVPREQAADALRAYGPWRQRWRSWANRERRDRPLRELFEQVYAWHRRLALEDDSMELVLGVGLLSWERPGQESVHRHLLTHRVETSFDRRTAELTVRLSPDSALRLEDQDFLDTDDGWVREQATALSEEISAQALHPLDPEVMELLPRWQERAMRQRVLFSAEWSPPTARDATARLTYAPTLTLRPRAMNSLVQLYGRIAESMTAEGRAPLGLAQMVMHLTDPERTAWDGHESGRPPLYGDDPLFPAKTNEQQRGVLRRLAKDTGVVVQGPPGTGKTHTIANLVSALLAQGQRVLVTSARDQPLNVLRDKLPPAVRDLCVLMVSSARQDGSSDLDRTVTALTHQVAGTDTESLNAEIGHLTSLREGTRSRIATLTEQLLALREEEYRHHSVASGYDGTLARIVRKVQDEETSCAWIGALAEDAPDEPPLTTEQAQELLVLLRQGADEPPPGTALPAPGGLPSPEQVSKLFTASRLDDQGLDERTVALRDTLGGLNTSITGELTTLLESAATALHHLALDADPARWDTTDTWLIPALEQRLSRDDARVWERVSSASAEIQEAAAALDALGLVHVRVPDGLDTSTVRRMVSAGQELHDYLAAKPGRTVRRSIPGFAPRAQRAAKEVLESCTVDGRAPVTAEDLGHVLSRLRAQAALDQAAERWRQAGAELPEADIEVRLVRLRNRVDQLHHVEAFAAAREAADALLVRHGVRVPLGTRTAWGTLVRAVGALGGRRAADEALRRLTDLDARLNSSQDGNHPAAEVIAVTQALREQDTEAYAKALEALEAARRRHERQGRCRKLLGTLRSAHPLLAHRLTEAPHETAWEQHLAGLGRAWAWATAGRFIRLQHSPGLENRLAGELAEQEELLERYTGELAAAWGRLHCLQRMTPEQRSALHAYRRHMQSVGKGQGRSASHFRAAARERMKVAQGAVPAWVVPASQIPETLRTEHNAFDVVIVDEASQAGLESLFLLWLAPRVIVVGDDKQCSPPVTGKGRHQAIRDSLAAHLPDLPIGLRELYMPHSNLYGLLTTFFPEVIRLSEHFRCVPEIINWSSETFYDGDLQPLRQYGGERLDPLRTVYVEGAVTEGREGRIRNPAEAEQIVSTLERLTADPAYQDKTMGVIVLRGFGQTKLLESLVQERIPAPTRERHRIRVGNAASFQGDERHVVLLSLVVTDAPRVVGGNIGDQQAYNVAASRAQDQLWLFHSIPRGQFKPKDLRLNLLHYMENPPAALASAQDIGPVRPDVPHPSFDSLFEQEVYLRIKERGYHVQPQFPAGPKTIDLVVVGAHGRLAVECDGERYHYATREQRDRDHHRDRELRRVGWTLWRLRESAFRFDPDKALVGLWAELDRLDIRPAVFTRPEAAPPSDESWSPTPLPGPEEQDPTGEANEADMTGVPHDNDQESPA